MKSLFLLFLYLFIGCWGIHAQVMLKSEYIGSSSFRDINNHKVGDTHGSAMIYQAVVGIPFSMKESEYGRPNVWGASLYGSYTNFNNKEMKRAWSPNEMMNLNLTLMHIRPIKEKWSLMFAVGVGIYTPHSNFSNIQAQNLLGNGGAIFIYHLNPSMDIGGGLVVNNSFGYPMVFPGMIFKWRMEGKYEINVELMNAAELSAGMKINDHLKLMVFGELNGSMALEKINGKNMIFTHQYVNTGVKAIVSLGKGFSIVGSAGVTPYRGAFYQERTLKAFFKDTEGDHDPHFSVAPSFSLALRYGF